MRLIDADKLHNDLAEMLRVCKSPESVIALSCAVAMVDIEETADRRTSVDEFDGIRRPGSVLKTMNIDVIRTMNTVEMSGFLKRFIKEDIVFSRVPCDECKDCGSCDPRECIRLWLISDATGPNGLWGDTR